MRSSPISGCPRRKTRAPDIKCWYSQMDGSWGVRNRQEWDRQCSCATTSNSAPLQSRRVQFHSCVLWDADLGTAIWRWEKMGDLFKRITVDRLRPELPDECPSRLASLIQRCWEHHPRERPNLPEICRELRYIKGLLLTGWTRPFLRTYDAAKLPTRSYKTC